MKRLIAVTASVLMVLAPGISTGAQGTQALAPPTATPVATGMHMILDVSKNGRIVLGRLTETGPFVIRDLVRNKTLRTLKSGPAYSYKSISSTGRYVHFTRTYTRAGCTYARPWVYDRVTNKSRLAAATRAGKALEADVDASRASAPTSATRSRRSRCTPSAAQDRCPRTVATSRSAPT